MTGSQNVLNHSDLAIFELRKVILIWPSLFQIQKTKRKTSNIRITHCLVYIIFSRRIFIVNKNSSRTMTSVKHHHSNVRVFLIFFLPSYHFKKRIKFRFSHSDGGLSSRISKIWKENFRQFSKIWNLNNLYKSWKKQQQFLQD